MVKGREWGTTDTNIFNISVSSKYGATKLVIVLIC